MALLGQGCLLLQQSWKIEWIISFHSPRYTNLPAAFPRGRCEEKANQNCLLPMLPQSRKDPARSPAFLLQPVAHLPLPLPRPDLQSGYYSRTVSKVKQLSWASWQCLLKPCSPGPAARACFLHAAGVGMPACSLTQRPCQEAVQIFTSQPTNLTTHHLHLSTETHL